ncbi:MAG: IS110 family transposase [Deltaproteobacteria bacterium]|nr:IS110 family transposase [Deltaproteobacteria bacterium]
MRGYTKGDVKGKDIFAGIDLHRKAWHVTVLCEGEDVFKGSIPGRWEALRHLLERYKGSRIKAAYEAGYFGFWLYDHLIEYGAECIVTPPSLLPIEYGNKVKTDRRDSKKLALLLAKGMLKNVWVPDKEGRHHREVSRRRRQLIVDRVRTQCRIKAALRLYGIDIPEPSGKWSKTYLENIGRFRFGDRWMDGSFRLLLEQYEFLNAAIKEQTELLKGLSETERYKEKVEILRSVPGIGLIVAMEILLELGDVSRFKKADQLAAYVGLTPSQYSSADKVRMGRITRAGKNGLRGTLIESAWRIITKDGAMRECYERIKNRSGSKRAIVAIARRLLLSTRRMLLENRPYMSGLAA